MASLWCVLGALGRLLKALRREGRREDRSPQSLHHLARIVSPFSHNFYCFVSYSFAKKIIIYRKTKIFFGFFACGRFRCLSLAVCRYRVPTPRRRRQHPHIVLADGFAAVSPISEPRRRREHPHIVLADVFAAVSPISEPRRRREHPHIVLADGSAAVSPISMPRRRREPSHIVLANGYSPSGWMNYA